MRIVACSVRPNDNLLDQCLFISKAFDELRDRGAITFAQAWLDELRFCFSAGQFRLDGVAALNGRIEIRFDFGSINCARADHLDQFVALRHDPRQLLFEVAALGALLFASRGEFSFAMAVLL
jgi:hypothetical protein